MSIIPLMYAFTSGFVLGFAFLWVGFGCRFRLRIYRAVCIESKRLVCVDSLISLFLCLLRVVSLQFPEHSSV